ncbi:hypothetical protein BH09PAT4_BH09PAT4_08170 [soil metagenome]
MITHEALVEQLQRINYNPNGWGRSEVNELCNILMPDEEIEELVNGYYEAGFALLVATKDRILLVDKKPLNYLTVEDIRFDMISEFDYSHRIIGAHVSISSGSKSLSFTSLNQQRLRRLLTYVQARMTEIKKTMHNQQETQQQHLEEMNEQLKQYLTTAQQTQQMQHAQLSYIQPAPPQYSATDGYVLPAPQQVAPQLISSQESFERAAAASVGLDRSPVQNTASSVLRKMVLTPQQIGLAGMRRVVPIVSAYARSAQPAKN